MHARTLHGRTMCLSTAGKLSKNLGKFAVPVQSTRSHRPPTQWYPVDIEAVVIVAPASHATASPPGPTRFARAPRVQSHRVGPMGPTCGPISGLQRGLSGKNQGFSFLVLRLDSGTLVAKARTAMRHVTSFLETFLSNRGSKLTVKVKSSHGMWDRWRSMCPFVHAYGHASTHMGMPRATNGHMMTKCAAA